MVFGLVKVFIDRNQHKVMARTKRAPLENLPNQPLCRNYAPYSVSKRGSEKGAVCGGAPVLDL